jgi:glycine betaine/choline ABC-type transport system substrate-binding protein
VDVIVNSPLNPKMVEYDLLELADDEEFFPSYQAAPVVRAEFLRAYPDAEAAIRGLAGRIDNPTAARLNYLVEVKGEDPREVAHMFLHDLQRRP